MRNWWCARKVGGDEKSAGSAVAKSKAVAAATAGAVVSTIAGAGLSAVVRTTFVSGAALGATRLQWLLQHGIVTCIAIRLATGPLQHAAVAGIATVASTSAMATMDAAFTVFATPGSVWEFPPPGATGGGHTFV
jgi:hypothetical protein